MAATLKDVEDEIRFAKERGDWDMVLTLDGARKQLLAAGQGGPTAEAGDIRRQQDIKETVGEYDKASPWSRLGSALGDMLTMGEQGVTLGFADELKARVRSLHPDATYEDALIEQQKMVQDAKARMNSTTPYSAEAFEGLTSLMLPTGAAKILPEAGALTKGLIYGTEGALESGVSSLGHGNNYKDAVIDSITGGVLGGAGGLLANPVARYMGGGRKEFKNAQELFDAQAAKPRNQGLMQRRQGMEDAILAEAGNPRKRMTAVAAKNDKVRDVIREQGPRAVPKKNKPTLEQQVLVEKIANAATPFWKNLMTEGGKGLRGGGGWGALYANLLNVPGGIMEGVGKVMSNKPKAELRKLKNSYLGGTPDDEAAMSAARDALSQVFVGAGRAQPAVLDGEPQNVFGKNYKLRP